MKKNIVATLVLLLSLLCMVSAKSKAASYDDRESVGFTGVYEPPGDDKASGAAGNQEGVLNKTERQQLKGNMIPDAGDSSNAVYLVLASLLFSSALFLGYRLKKKLIAEI